MDIEKDRKLIETIVQLKTETLMDLLTEILTERYEKVISTKDYIYAVGTIPVGLVAHCDTVWPSPPKEFYYDAEKSVLWGLGGAGFDDRSGVAAILKIIQAGYRPSILFTTGEEIGGIGAQSLITDFQTPIEPLKYLIELDRTGEKDIVTYSNANKDFIDYIESFGFEFDYGSFSDVEFIGPIWDIAYANLSIGYYHEHTTSEIQNLKIWNETIEKVKQILDDIKNLTIEKFVYVPDIDNLFFGWKGLYALNSYSNEKVCHKCNEKLIDRYKTIYIDGHNYCDKCADYCYYCGEPYLIGEEHMCKF